MTAARGTTDLAVLKPVERLHEIIRLTADDKDADKAKSVITAARMECKEAKNIFDEHGNSPLVTAIVESNAHAVKMFSEKPALYNPSHREFFFIPDKNNKYPIEVAFDLVNQTYERPQPVQPQFESKGDAKAQDNAQEFTKKQITKENLELIAKRQRIFDLLLNELLTRTQDKFKYRLN